MTYDIHLNSIAAQLAPVVWTMCGGIVLLLAACVLTFDWRARPRLGRTIGVIAYVLAAAWGGVFGIAGFHVRADAERQQMTSVAHAWRLNAHDAKRLLANIYEPGAHQAEADRDPTLHEMWVTTGAHRARAYLLKRGDTLRLMVDSVPLPVHV